MNASKKTKVLILVGPLTFGGVEVWVYDLVKTIDRSKFEPVIGTIVYKGMQHSPELYKLYRQTNVEIYEITGRSEYDPRLIFDIGNMIEQVKPDVIHANYVTWGVIAGLIKNVPTISHLHHTYRAIHRPIFNNILHKFVKHYITINQSNRMEIAKLSGVALDKIKVIYCGIDVDHFTCSSFAEQARVRDMLNITAEDRVVITICRLHPVKGLRNFIEMAQIVKANYKGGVKF